MVRRGGLWKREEVSQCSGEVRTFQVRRGKKQPWLLPLSTSMRGATMVEACEVTRLKEK